MRRPRSFRRLSGSCLLPAVLLAGCHSFVPAEMESITPGEEVRVRVPRAEASRLGEARGEIDQVLEGRVLERREGELLLNVGVATRQVSFRFEPLAQRVSLEEQLILELERKELDGWRTGTLIAAVGTGVAVAVYAALSGETGKSDIPDGGPPVAEGGPISLGFRIR